MVRPALLCMCAVVVSLTTVAALSAVGPSRAAVDYTDDAIDSYSEQEQQRAFLRLLRSAAAAKRDRPAERGGPGPPPVSRATGRSGSGTVNSPSSSTQQQQQPKSNKQMIIRQPRGGRQYDVPQIECPPSEDGSERFACPSPDRMGRYRCIDAHVLCDGFIDCPNAEDEDRMNCMFYKTTKEHLEVLADALLRWARGR